MLKEANWLIGVFAQNEKYFNFNENLNDERFNRQLTYKICCNRFLYSLRVFWLITHANVVI